MKEVTISIWCDACVTEHPDERIPGETHAVKIDGTGAQIDLCRPHEKELLGPLRALIEERGVREKPEPVAKASTGRCPICGSTMAPGSVVNHIYNVHAGGRPAPMDACPECGHQFADNRAMGAHRTASHGYSAMEDALARARARQNGSTA